MVPDRTSGKSRSGYRAAIHGRMGDGMASSSDFTIRKGAPVNVVWARFDGGPLIFRPLPAVDPDDPRRFLPCRYSLAEYDFTDWTRRYTAVRGAGSGENRFSFILEDPTRDDYGINAENPYRVVWSRIWRAVKKEALPRLKGVNPEQWLACVERRGGAMPKVPRPASVYLFLGIVLHNDKETYVGAGKAPLGLGKTDTAQVVQLSATAGEAIWDALSDVKDGYRGVDTEDFDKALVYGDPVHPDRGIFITVMGRHAATPYSEPAAGYDLDADSGRASRRDRESFARYTVAFDRKLVIDGRTVPGVSPALPPKAVERILSKAVQFDDILYIPTTDELCVLCARAWKNEPYILEYGWGDHPQFFTAEVRKILMNARTLPSAAVFAENENLKEGEGAGPLPDTDLPETDDAVTEDLLAWDTSSGQRKPERAKEASGIVPLDDDDLPDILSEDNGEGQDWLMGEAAPQRSASTTPEDASDVFPAGKSGNGAPDKRRKGGDDPLETARRRAAKRAEK